MRKRLRILVLVHEDLVPPESIEGLSDIETAPWKTEYDVTVTLRELGHTVLPLGVGSDLGVLRTAMFEFKPHITFNLLEEFHGVAVYDQHVVSYLELMKRRYTGCNPRGLMIAHDKALSKQILSYHRIRVPEFIVLPLGRKVRRPRRIGRDPRRPIDRRFPKCGRTPVETCPRVAPGGKCAAPTAPASGPAP